MSWSWLGGGGMTGVGWEVTCLGPGWGGDRAEVGWIVPCPGPGQVGMG